MKRINTKALIEEANAVEVAQYIGMEVIQRGANYFIECPGHEKRMGKKDENATNCVLYKDGYRCFVCDPTKTINTIDMVREFLDCSFIEAVNTIAEIYGGKKLFQTDGKTEEKLPLSQEDLKLIGLRASGKLFSPINGSYQHFEPDEGTHIEKTSNEYLLAKVPSSYSLLNLKRDNEKAFNYLIATKAKEAGVRYTKALRDFGDRTSPKASTVFDLFNENGGVDDSVFYGIQNALKKKIWRCKEIYDAFNNKEGNT